MDDRVQEEEGKKRRRVVAVTRAGGGEVDWLEESTAKRFSEQVHSLSDGELNARACSANIPHRTSRGREAVS